MDGLRLVRVSDLWVFPGLAAVFLSKQMPIELASVLMFFWGLAHFIKAKALYDGPDSAAWIFLSLFSGCLFVVYGVVMYVGS